ncbi:unnamed protein product [Allacma fusca]|uniref:Uncharacterized protein n=1 Tax=Allacma fusca TaxID=39272 RepID=A0A8J2P742_9HEXA|nr:unnamed protein product [Allacma fusca]
MIVKLFTDSLSHDSFKNRCKETLDIFDDVVLMFNKTDEAFGYLIFAFTLGLLPFHILKFSDLFSGNWASFIRYTFFTSKLISVSWLACSCNSRTKKLIPWLKHQIKRDSVREVVKKENKSLGIENILKYRLPLVLAEIDHGIGLKGKVFVFTYSFTCQVISVILTYAIISIQLNASKTEI